VLRVAAPDASRAANLPGEHCPQIFFLGPAAVTGLFGEAAGGFADARALEGLGLVQGGLDGAFGHAQAASPSEVTAAVVKSTPKARS
jgi:hypothetical protein